MGIPFTQKYTTVYLLRYNVLALTKSIANVGSALQSRGVQKRGESTFDVGIIRDLAELNLGVQSRQGRNCQNWTRVQKVEELICDVTLPCDSYIYVSRMSSTQDGAVQVLQEISQCTPKSKQFSLRLYAVRSHFFS